MSDFANANILVVGGAGFVGSNLVRKLLPENPRKVVVVDNLLSAERSNVPSDNRVELIDESITKDSVLNRLPNDFKTIVAKAFNEVALLERDDLNKLDRSLQADLEKKGLTFTKPDLDSFRAKLRSAGFYEEWKGKIGNEAWALLEKQVGKLA